MTRANPSPVGHARDHLAAAERLLVEAHRRRELAEGLLMGAAQANTTARWIESSIAAAHVHTLIAQLVLDLEELGEGFGSATIERAMTDGPLSD